MKATKRISAIFLALVLVLSLLPVSVFAAGSDYSTRLLVDKVAEDKVDVKWMVQTSNGAVMKTVNSIIFKYDNTKYDMLTNDGTVITTKTMSDNLFDHYTNSDGDQIVTTINSPLVWNNSGIYTEAKETNTFVLINLASGSSTKTKEYTTETALAVIHLQLKSGTVDDGLPGGSIALATAAEADGCAQSGIVIFIGAGEEQFIYGRTDGTADTLLTTPVVAPGAGVTFAKPALTSSASVSISGTPKIGETLTATPSGLPSDAGNLTYKWYRGDDTAPISGADTATYTPSTKDDVGKTIKVVVTAENYSGNATATTTNTVEKADGPTAPTGLAVVSVTDTTITVTENAAWEYSKNDGSTWQDSNVFTGLAPNNYYSQIVARVKETDTRKASEKSDAINATTAKGSAGSDIIAALKATHTPYNDTYDGTAHDAFSSVATLPAGWASTYSRTEAGPYTAAIPQVTNVADSGTIYVKFANPSYADVIAEYDVTVSAKDISGAVITYGTQNTYNGSEQDVVVASVVLNGTTLTVGSNYALDGNTGKATNVEGKKLEIFGKGNYSGSATAATEWKLQQATPVVGDFVTSGLAASYPYNGSEQSAPVPTTAKTGMGTVTVNYPDSTKPKFVGDYTLQFSVAEGQNYTAAGPFNYGTMKIVAVEDPAVITTAASMPKGGHSLDLRTLVSGAKGDVTFAIAPGATSATLSGYTLTSTGIPGTVNINVTIRAKDENGDSKVEYTGKTGTITVNVTTKTTEALAGGVSQTGCTYGDTLGAPTYTAPEGTISTTVTYSGTLRRGGSYSDTAKPTEAGEYTVTVKCETSTHIYQATSDPFIIKPKSIAGADVTLGTALTYNAASQTQTVATVKLGGTDITASCDISNNTQENAGSYQLTVTAKDESNYTGSVSKDFTIAKKSITPTIEVSGSYTYTGSAITPTYKVKDGSTELAATDFNAVVTDNINAGNGKITVTEKATGNYTFRETQQSFAIGKGTYGDQTATGSAKYGTTGTVELSSYLKTGYALGTITKTNAGIFESDPSMDGTLLKFTFKDVSSNAGQTAEITVPVTSTTNYNSYDIKVAVTVNAKTVPTVTAPVAKTNLTYNGTAQALISAGATNGGEMQYSLTSGSGYSTAIPTATNANTYTVYYKVVGDSEYADVAEASVSVTIAKKDVTVAPKSFTITKGGAIPTFELVYTGLVGSDTLTPSATPDFTCYETGTTPVSTSTAAGTYTITWANEGVTTFTGADNYNVTKTATGTLTINNLAPSGGGGGGGVSTYAISVDSAKNGTVTVSPKNAAKGTTITLMVEPDKGYTLETITATDASGNKLKLTEKSGKYTFTMPASKVTVKATFMEDNSMLNFFVDVPADAYYYDAVLWAAEEGITGGVDATHFAPNATCTRAQAVTFLWRAAGSPAPKSSMMPFTDVPAGSYYETAVLWAVENGITKGTSETMFSPDATCTRAQIVTFLWRANGSPAVSGNSAFTDVASDAYYAAAVTWAEKNDVTGGIGGGLFGSDNNCTRAQIVTFIYRSVK